MLDMFIKLHIGKRTIKIPAQSIRLLFARVFPEWMRNSKIPAPNTRLDLLRTALRNLSRPFLPELYEQMYGEKLNLGRGDSLPIITYMIADFAVYQLMQGEIVIEVDENEIARSIYQIRGAPPQPSDAPDRAYQADEGGEDSRYSAGETAASAGG